ncbi:MAG: hypothetical protein QI199_02885, partial [Candidatus Korarchaeota archaeon]|nr:hypothetical protein [Candidatus Korarchaeota archaeon]
MEVDVTLVLGPDTESDRVLEIAREAARILKDDYGIWAYIVPVTAWGHGRGASASLLGDTMIPIVYINGYP